MTVRVALISDVHGNIFAIEAVLAAIRESGADRIVCAGDIVGYYPYVNETLGRVRAEGIDCVMGNHDAILTGNLPSDAALMEKYCLDRAAEVIEPEHLEWLRNLPRSLHIEDGEGFRVVHGSPRDPLSEYVYPDGDLAAFEGEPSGAIVLGHTHWPMLRHAGDVMIINPGSCGQPRDYMPGACFALFDTAERHVDFRRVSYDLKRLTDDLGARGLRRELIDILWRTR